MKATAKTFTTLAVVSILNGCAIHQKVTPVAAGNEKSVCIIENMSVKHNFLPSYHKTLAEKGYSVKILDPSASINQCQMTSTYNANWRWDLALYMAYAEIKVYTDGKVIGEAKYDSTKGGGNLGKFINADAKIGELVNQLFP